MAGLCSAEGVVVEYGATTALAGVSLTVDEGASVALVGPSGAGKSTLLLCLAGLITPARGVVRFDQVDLAQLTVDERANLRLRSFGFVMQGGELMPELTLSENVQLPMRLAGTGAREAARRAAKLLDELGVGDASHRRPDEVSGGQAQRAAVARAIVHHPRVVFADEPTGALDSVAAEGVMAALRERVAAVGSALVMVTHDRSLAAQLDRVVEVRDGVIHEVTGDEASGDQLPTTGLRWR